MYTVEIHGESQSTKNMDGKHESVFANGVRCTMTLKTEIYT